ncbi:HAD domain-containing protein [Nocardia carnea]|uniref:HAD domain-containing protein n=1 Tax=Nocardia carnea TaxID=37328 RepID=UPI0024555408|nr:HAD domain-containing protein [Nocardia carnea]
MTARSPRPLLFLDVDGPLLPFGESPRHEPRAAATDTHLSRLNTELGRRLATLPFSLVWATTWEDDANTELAPRLGLPELPVVHWPDSTPAHEHEDRWFGLCWKTRTVVDWAAGHPFAWIDDEITEADHSWVRAHHPARAFLHRVDPARGLTDSDFTTLGQWLP